MRTYRSSRLTPAQRRSLTIRNRANDQSAATAVRGICLAVKKRGNSAVREFSRRFDGIAPRIQPLPASALIKARRGMPPPFLRALRIAAANIARFHRDRMGPQRPVRTMPGVKCWRTVTPISRVGLYVPAGSAPLPSTVLMLGIPALLAGCRSIVLFTPPMPDGSANPFILAAAAVAGIKQVVPVGGAQAIAAMAYGTQSIPKVDKIFGPGNKFVDMAKQFVAADPDGCAVDMPAGPSELLVISDGTANPAFVAADLLSQAEHDPDARVALVTTSELLAEHVQRELGRQLGSLPRKSIAKRSLEAGFVLIVPSLSEAVRFSNDYAPEHLSLQIASPKKFAALIQNAGSVFLGSFSPVAAGDYASGTNHTLPTGGAARVFSGISVASFQKSVSFQSLSRNGLNRLSNTIKTIAVAEGLEAHRQAVIAREQQ
ncbi:MAG TPA: histidinol dehydrogenase [Bacteroidota bacterium]